MMVATEGLLRTVSRRLRGLFNNYYACVATTLIETEIGAWSIPRRLYGQFLCLAELRKVFVCTTVSFLHIGARLGLIVGLVHLLVAALRMTRVTYIVLLLPNPVPSMKRYLFIRGRLQLLRWLLDIQLRLARLLV